MESTMQKMVIARIALCYLAPLTYYSRFYQEE